MAAGRERLPVVVRAVFIRHNDNCNLRVVFCTVNTNRCRRIVLVYVCAEGFKQGFSGAVSLRSRDLGRRKNTLGQSVMTLEHEIALKRLSGYQF